MLDRIPPAKMAAYRKTAEKRRQRKELETASRYERAWRLARQASALLKEEFGARRVAVFGSLLFVKRFHQRSDIDLAVWGVDESRYLRAVARLLTLANDISIDLVDMERAKPNLRAVVEREGEDL